MPATAAHPEGSQKVRIGHAIRGLLINICPPTLAVSVRPSYVVVNISIVEPDPNRCVAALRRAFPHELETMRVSSKQKKSSLLTRIKDMSLSIF
jgi:hypothetical protein